MYKILIFSLCVSTVFFGCSSLIQSPLFSNESTPQDHFPEYRKDCCSRVGINLLESCPSHLKVSSNDELERLGLDKAKQNKLYYVLPTPSCFECLQIDTPTPVDKSYTKEWLKDWDKRETQLFRNEDNERLRLEKEYDHLINAIRHDEFFKRLAIQIKKSEK